MEFSVRISWHVFPHALYRSDSTPKTHTHIISKYIGMKNILDVLASGTPPNHSVQRDTFALDTVMRTHGSSESHSWTSIKSPNCMRFKPSSAYDTNCGDCELTQRGFDIFMNNPHGLPYELTLSASALATALRICRDGRKPQSLSMQLLLLRRNL